MPEPDLPPILNNILQPWPHDQNEICEMDAKNRTFKDTTVLMDGADFEGCIFERCKLVVTGATPISLKDITFIDCEFLFDGPAGHTLNLLSKLYAAGAHAVVESTFDAIRAKGNAGRPAVTN